MIYQEYNEIYQGIYRNFLAQIESSGLELDSESYEEQTSTKREQLREKGALLRNSDHSIYLNRISPACEACRTGVGSVTLFVSLLCHRKCYYCFNPNQEEYEHFTKNKRNCSAELLNMHKSGEKISHLALSGGEPLLHQQEMINFFQTAQTKYPSAHTRLYTSGDLLDENTLQELKEAGLQEIRFSIKMEDESSLREKVLAKIELAKSYLPSVMVEMPVIPGTFEDMKILLLELDRIGIDGINLLEFCFPFHNAEEYVKRAFKIKNLPFHVLYNYWYAGGLPVSGSELECLDLLEFALDHHLTLGIHYCSLENKQTGQIYQQNLNQKVSEIMFFSPKDFFFKSAKVFGDDISHVLKVFKKKDIKAYNLNKDYGFLEFHVKHISMLKNLDLEIAVSFHVMEERPDGKYLRELKVDLIDPKVFDLKEDI